MSDAGGGSGANPAANPPAPTQNAQAATPPATDPNVLTLVVGGQMLTGWTAVSVTLSCEHVPNHFDLVMTDRYPGQPDVVCQPGDSCQIMLGSTVVITGWIDTYAPSIGPRAHAIRVQGRGLCEDLVDCSAVIKGMQVGGASLLTLAQAMAAPYKITVTGTAGAGAKIPQFNVTLGETPYEIIERAARWSQMLSYEDANGNLVLSAVGTTQHASGFGQGVNVQRATAAFSLAERYSQYLPAVMSTDFLSDIGSGNTPYPAVTDAGVPRFRQLIVVSEQFVFGGQSLAQLRAQWEATRRYGRSQQVRLTVDNWRDSAGTLWTPNFLVSVDIPALKLNSVDWVISTVTFLRDGDTGTTAELLIMPKEAFAPEPSALQLIDWQVSQDLHGGNSGGAGNGGPGSAPAVDPGLA